jgi:hypothetical protein
MRMREERPYSKRPYSICMADLVVAGLRLSIKRQGGHPRLLSLPTGRVRAMNHQPGFTK